LATAPPSRSGLTLFIDRVPGAIGSTRRCEPRALPSRRIAIISTPTRPTPSGWLEWVGAAGLCQHAISEFGIDPTS